MRHRIGPAALLVLAASTSAFAQAPNKAAIEKVLIANEAKVGDAIAAHDMKTFNELVAADGVAAAEDGFMKTSDLPKTFEQMKVTSHHMMDAKVLWIDDKSALVTYTWMGQGTYMDRPMPPQTFASTVWTQRNGKWVAVFHQESIAAIRPAAPAKKK